jgi:hypothetical protein
MQINKVELRLMTVRVVRPAYLEKISRGLGSGDSIGEGRLQRGEMGR